MKLTILYPYSMESKLEVTKAANACVEDGRVYFVPEGVKIQDMVNGQDYRNLKKLMRLNSSTLFNRIKFLFKGWSK